MSPLTNLTSAWKSLHWMVKTLVGFIGGAGLVLGLIRGPIQGNAAAIHGNTEAISNAINVEALHYIEFLQFKADMDAKIDRVICHLEQQRYETDDDPATVPHWEQCER